MRWIVVLLLLLAAHFNQTANVPAEAGKASIIWPFAKDTVPTLGFLGPAREITQLLSIIAALCFLLALLALFGLWVPAQWWPWLVGAGSVTSILLYVLYLGPWAIIPIMIDLVLLWGVFIQQWTVPGLRGG